MDQSVQDPASDDAGTDRVRELFESALAVQARAYVPYSHFRVGAAVRSAGGGIYTGCNVENAAYPQGWCAEASALAAMVSAGEREIVEVVTVCDGELLGTPCGGCRQKLREFATPRTRIYVAGPEGVRRTYSMDELLPDSFGPEHLS